MCTCIKMRLKPFSCFLVSCICVMLYSFSRVCRVLPHYSFLFTKVSKGLRKRLVNGLQQPGFDQRLGDSGDLHS